MSVVVQGLGRIRWWGVVLGFVVGVTICFLASVLVYILYLYFAVIQQYFVYGVDGLLRSFMGFKMDKVKVSGVVIVIYYLGYREEGQGEYSIGGLRRKDGRDVD